MNKKKKRNLMYSILHKPNNRLIQVLKIIIVIFSKECTNRLALPIDVISPTESIILSCIQVILTFFVVFPPVKIWIIGIYNDVQLRNSSRFLIQMFLSLKIQNLIFFNKFKCINNFDSNQAPFLAKTGF